MQENADGRLSCRLDRISGHSFFRPLPFLSPDFLTSSFYNGQFTLDRMVSLPELLQTVLDPIDTFRTVHAGICKKTVKLECCEPNDGLNSVLKRVGTLDYNIG